MRLVSIGELIQQTWLRPTCKTEEWKKVKVLAA